MLIGNIVSFLKHEDNIKNVKFVINLLEYILIKNYTNRSCIDSHEVDLSNVNMHSLCEFISADWVEVLVGVRDKFMHSSIEIYRAISKIEFKYFLIEPLQTQNNELNYHD